MAQSMLIKVDFLFYRGYDLPIPLYLPKFVLQEEMNVAAVKSYILTASQAFEKPIILHIFFQRFFQVCSLQTTW